MSTQRKPVKRAKARSTILAGAPRIFRFVPTATRKRLPTLPIGTVPRTVPDGCFIWHNHVMHTVGMGHGLNGFRYRYAQRPINYRLMMRCHCGVIGLPHYSIRAFGKQRCRTIKEMVEAGALHSGWEAA